MPAYREEPKRNSINGPGGGVLAKSRCSAASLFAFGVARQASVASVAMVSNAIDHAGAQFDTGSLDDGLRVVKGIARAAPISFRHCVICSIWFSADFRPGITKPPEANQLAEVVWRRFRTPKPSRLRKNSKLCHSEPRSVFERGSGICFFLGFLANSSIPHPQTTRARDDKRSTQNLGLRLLDRRHPRLKIRPRISFQNTHERSR